MSKKSSGVSSDRRPQNIISIDGRALPSSVEAERLVLGALQIDASTYPIAANLIKAEDFALHKHQLIFSSMQRIAEKGKPIDRVTVAHELLRTGQLEAVDGLSYLASLDDGLPQLYNFEAYVRIIREKSLLRKTIHQSHSILERAMADSEPPDELIPNAAALMIDLAAEAQPSDSAGPQGLGSFLETYEGGLATFLDPTRRKSGLMTGYHWLDERTGGLRPGELITITGLTGSGKSTLAFNIGAKLAIKDKKTVAAFSMEMSKEMVFTRMACAEGRVDQLKFRLGYLGTDERYRLMSAANALDECNMLVDDSSNISLVEITARLHAIRAKHNGLDLVIIDYIQLIRGEGTDKSNRAQEVSSITRGLKILAGTLPVPVIALSQLRKGAPGQKPKFPELDDLKESSSISQDSDVVMGVFRPELYVRDREDLKGMAEVGIMKQRNGPLGRTRLVFLGPIGKFENPADEMDEQRSIDE
mgnify:CR=1 FL=1